MINLIYTDESGQLIEDKEYTAVGFNGLQVEPADLTWIDLPTGADIMTLPGKLPLGIANDSGELDVLEGVQPIAAILPMGYTRTLLPAYEVDVEQDLPLFGYTAVGAENGRLKVAAIKTDEDLKWNPVYYNTADLSDLIAARKREFPENRLVEHLANCSLQYHCLTAENIFYHRWEAGIPVSPKCNADCLGCISLQPSECCPSPQQRISFIPTTTEIVQLAATHLQDASEAIISFGQGCEGEPSLQWKIIAEAIKEVRFKTKKGVININTNAGHTDGIKALVDAGLDSIRVSLFSADTAHYAWYHRPCGYTLDDVKNSLRYAADAGLMVAINLLFYPGFTNQAEETEKLWRLIEETGVRQIQLRNLNLDPQKLESLLIEDEIQPIAEWLKDLQQRFPQLLIGNYSIAKKAE